MWYDLKKGNFYVTGLALPPDYLATRTLTDLQQPPTTLTNSDFPFSVDGKYVINCNINSNIIVIKTTNLMS